MTTSSAAAAAAAVMFDFSSTPVKCYAHVLGHDSSTMDTRCGSTVNSVAESDVHHHRLQRHRLQKQRPQLLNYGRPLDRLDRVRRQS